MRNFILLICLMMFVVGCKLPAAGNEETVTIDNPTAVDILENDHEADIFQYNRLVYINASKIEWVQENTYERGPEISEIRKQSVEGEKFTDGTASILPIGTKIFQVVGNGQLLLMVEKDGEEIIYLALIEG